MREPVMVLFCLLRGAAMLNIRINMAIDLKKVAVVVTSWFIVFGQLFTPAQALPAAKAKVVKVALTYLTVITTKTEAKEALNSKDAKYFDPESLAFLTLYAKGVPMAEWKCLRALWQSESHFNPKALNMSSKAFGIAQFLPSTWDNYKVTKTPNALLQIKYGLRYIKVRYGTACQAQTFHMAHGWY